MMGVGLCGDIRVSRQFERILEDITKSGSLVVRKLGADRAAEIGAHRFLGSERVTPQAILEEAAERTARACRGRRVVVAQDTWLAWITARLGGWHGYYRPPGPKTMADGWRRLAAMLDGYAFAHGKSLV